MVMWVPFVPCCLVYARAQCWKTLFELQLLTITHCEFDRHVSNGNTICQIDYLYMGKFISVIYFFFHSFKCGFATTNSHTTLVLFYSCLLIRLSFGILSCDVNNRNTTLTHAHLTWYYRGSRICNIRVIFKQNRHLFNMLC